MSRPLVGLPSLDLIRGFVAVGRRMSITLAAEDLCLTQSAVSRQIHALEEALGVKLLSRGYRSIAFTPEGERLFRIADRSVEELQKVFGDLMHAGDRIPVTVTASIGVAGLWLLPRLGRFQQKHPEVDVRVAASNKIFDLSAEGVDLAIRYCAAASAPAGAVRLFGEAMAPVAHPSLNVRRIDAEAIQRHVLLEFDDPGRPWLQWPDWLGAMGMDDARPKAVLRFNQYDQIIHAAIAGQGLALGRLALVEPMLRDGRLVALHSGASQPPRGYAYWLLQAQREPRIEVRAVADWIKAEALDVDSALAEPAPA
jgi:DNA-binding transcriptional LysR family regulator